ncbi:hypothetical protein EOPP23_16960 [Endozoicomonas sp. OPT23]|uniref:hypothetical protein n=1 Tax=Endozoicomonas sp. OPT23 TaxID=2072845 RepID=UPI00129A0FEB|nr:hypothetical protein [Endozoicomonas sp. OPT23]MRI34676.1 hypothetical protein [Endozoicomonas sp. OPT23]
MPTLLQLQDDTAEAIRALLEARLQGELSKAGNHSPTVVQALLSAYSRQYETVLASLSLSSWGKAHPIAPELGRELSIVVDKPIFEPLAGLGLE